MIERAYEVNFDGLPGPTHNFAGLSAGNNASRQHRHETSHPRAAALEGLAKMRLLYCLGVRQAVLPPHARPSLAALRRLGFASVEAAREAPHLLAAASSASGMWAANLATVAPSSDTADGRVHFTPANLAAHLHRSLEADFSTRVLRAIFGDEDCFAVHDALPACAGFGDEGAANHVRFCGHGDAHGEPGVHLFAYGGRQGEEASRAVARLHGLDPEMVVFARQGRAAIDAGVFHNDVISTGNRSFFLCHEKAFEDAEGVLAALRAAFFRRSEVGELRVEWVRSAEVSVAEAVGSYLFNSQVVDLPDDAGMALIAPSECAESAAVRGLIERMVGDADCPLVDARYLNLRESMSNGGGPACLRLRVVLTERELNRVRGRVLWNPSLDGELVGWVERNYRETLEPGDLGDPALLDDSRRALGELSGILELADLFQE